MQSRLRRAKLRLDACMEDLDYRTSRGLSRQLMLHLASCNWIRGHQNVLITGPTGVGKSFIACALAHKACLEGFTARFFRMPRLLEDLAVARAEGRYLKLLNTLSKLDVLVLDDWSLKRLNSSQQEDVHELLDDRVQRRSTITIEGRIYAKTDGRFVRPFKDKKSVNSPPDTLNIHVIIPAPIHPLRLRTLDRNRCAFSQE